MDYSRRSSHDTPQAAGRRYSYQYPIPAADVDPDADYEERRLADFADGAQYDDVADSVSAVGAHGQGQGQGQPRSYPGSAAGYGYAYGGPNPYFAAAGGVVAPGAPGTPPFASAPPPPRSSVSWPQYDHDPYASAYGNPYPHAYPLPPPSMASASNSDHTHLTHPISLYPASPASETPPAIFGVHAAHHVPSSQGGHRSSRGYAPGDRLPSFPQWSATWYDGHLSANGHAYTTVKPPSGVSGWEAATMSGGQRSWDAPIGPGGPGSAAAYEAYMKEERIKMLERKFGKPKTSHRGQDGGDDGAGGKEGEDGEEKEEQDNPDADLPPGSVTSRGVLVLPWRKTVLSLKSGFVLFALAALLCAVLDLVVVKVASTATAGSAAPPAIKNSYTSYVVHAASLFSALGATWLFLFRPCCCDAGRKAAKGGAGAQGGEGGLTQGGMVIPILGGMDGGMGGKKNKKKMKKGQMMPGSPTINLIVDPTLLGGGGRKNSRDDSEHSSDSASEDEDEWDALPGEYRRSPRRKRRRGGRRSSRGGRGGFLTRLRTQRIHALALRSFAHTLLWLSGICIIILAALCVALFMSKGKATSCKASTAVGAATWCGIWACELAMLFLALFAGLGFVGFGIVGYRSGRRARERLAQA